MLSEERPADDQGAVGKVKPKGEDHKNAFPLVKKSIFLNYSTSIFKSRA